MATPCTCSIGKTPCNSAFVIELETGLVVLEVDINRSASDLKNPELFEMLCAGSALQRLNKTIRKRKEKP